MLCCWKMFEDEYLIINCETPTFVSRILSRERIEMERGKKVFVQLRALKTAFE